VQYSHSKEKAQEFCDKVLASISAYDLKPLPQIFELWYAYHAECNPDVVRAIDILKDSHQKITDERCEEIHQRFLSDHKENARVRVAGDRIQETIKDVSVRVRDVKSATHKYNEELQSATGRLSHDVSPDEIRQTLKVVLDNTSEMIEHNVRLEHELEKSTLVMQELQRDLEIVRKQALSDSLTGLGNRKAFENELTMLCEQAHKSGEAFCLILLDIDHFKIFNDSYGHQVGDQVLRLVARTLTDGVKGRDMAARFGGEEFAVLLPHTNLMGAMKVADSLRAIVQGKELINRNTGDKLGRVTLSAGVAEYVRGESVEDFIDRADAALYAAKNSGRNQVAAASPPSG
jgi:diguanylate cyclase